MALGLAVVLLVSTAAAQTEPAENGVKAEETVPADSRPTEAATVLPTQDPPSGGIVGPAPTQEPTATEPDDVEGAPGESEGEPTEETENEGVAPAVVVVVLWTADGGSVSDRTTVCVSEICQPVGAVASGTKIEFERIVQGWHEIAVFDAGSYEDGFSSVSVRPGQRATVDVTLDRSRREEPTPPPPATGPIRQPLQQVVDGEGNDEGEARASNTQFTANVTGGDERAVVRVTSLPATGAGASRWDSDVSGGVLMVGGALALAFVAIVSRRRAA